MKTSASLNWGQKQAVEALEGPVLILAGAGAGKTKTIVERIANLIRSGISPSSILAITFTNKAASEMKERVKTTLSGIREMNLPVSSPERPFIGTFHALGAHLIREHCDRLALPRHFSIYDRVDSRTAIKETLKTLGLDPKEFDPSHLLGIISKEKSNAVTLEEFSLREEGEYFGSIISKVWGDYQRILKKERALDFDDLLLEANRLLADKKILTHYQEIWKYVHVDEYQDTNHIQYLIVKKLANKYKNICAVGDIDQNIYSWRGARLRNILDFEKDYPQAKVILLEENYRSTKTILDVANLIIQKNIYRKEKRLFTQNEVGEQLSIFEAPDETSEAVFVARKVLQLIKSRVSPKEIAVLYRANFQSRVLEEIFLTEGIPYQLVGTRFFERKEIKDALSYIKASLNPESLPDLKRIINTPPRGIGKVSLLKIAEGTFSSLPKKTRTNYEELLNILRKIKEKIGHEKTSEVIRYTIKISGIYDWLKQKEGDEERLENIEELVTLATKYDSLSGAEGIESLLLDAAHFTDQDELQEERDGVKLMTVHAAKGLEFDYIFIVGLEEDLFPHHRSEEKSLTKEEAEEERRLFYVALTRARKKIYLSFAETRTLFGSRQVNLPSEFLLDIPDKFLVREEGNYQHYLKPLRTIRF